MDDVAANIIDRATALADFDHARDDFELAMATVPDEAIDYRPEGDDYSIADLVPHVTHSLLFYSSLIDQMREAEFQAVVAAAGEPQDAQLIRHRESRAAVAAPVGRKADLDDMEAAHDSIAARLREMAEAEYAIKSDVTYPESAEPYASSAADIIGWVTSHYREHIEQVAEMVGKWKAEKGRDGA